MTNPCINCANNREGQVNSRACSECLCPVSASSAFRQMYAEINRLREQLRITDFEWTVKVKRTAAELIELLERSGE